MGLALGVHAVEHKLVFQAVHGPPESGVPVGRQLAFADQAAERFLYQFFTRPQVVEDILAKNEEAAVDPVISGLAAKVIKGEDGLR